MAGCVLSLVCVLFLLHKHKTDEKLFSGQRKSIFALEPLNCVSAPIPCVSRPPSSSLLCHPPPQKVSGRKFGIRGVLLSDGY